ncbi:MAG: hypothetical protein ACAH59_11340 [Pseudobdellovibrionaceae bacterium]
MKILISLFLIFAGSGAWADDDSQTHALLTAEEQEIHLRAKKRLYPGGQDEDSLKVQSQLPQVTRKVGPTTEAPEADSPDAATD